MKRNPERTIEDARAANALAQRNYQDRLKPERKALREIRKYGSKKDAMMEVQQTDPNWENQLLEKLISEIRGILGKKEE